MRKKQSGSHWTGSMDRLCTCWILAIGRVGSSIYLINASEGPRSPTARIGGTVLVQSQGKRSDGVTQATTVAQGDQVIHRRNVQRYAGPL